MGKAQTISMYLTAAIIGLPLGAVIGVGEVAWLHWPFPLYLASILLGGSFTGWLMVRLWHRRYC